MTFTRLISRLRKPPRSGHSISTEGLSPLLSYPVAAVILSPALSWLISVVAQEHFRASTSTLTTTEFSASRLTEILGRNLGMFCFE